MTVSQVAQSQDANAAQGNVPEGPEAIVPQNLRLAREATTGILRMGIPGAATVSASVTTAVLKQVATKCGSSPAVNSVIDAATPAIADGCTKGSRSLLDSPVGNRFVALITPDPR